MTTEKVIFSVRAQMLNPSSKISVVCVQELMVKVSLCSEIEPTFPCHIQLINNPIISVAMAHVSPLLVIVMQLEQLSESLLAEL